MVDLVDGEYKIYAVYRVICRVAVRLEWRFSCNRFGVNQASQLCRILPGFSTGDWADRRG